MKKFMFSIFLLSFLSIFGYAQQASKTSTDIANAPIEYIARYEGGIFGSSGKETGTLKIDDEKKRLVFVRVSNGKEIFEIPYDALTIVFPDSKDSVPQGAKIVGAVGLPGTGEAYLINKETKYASISFIDPDVDIHGTVSFRFDSQEKMLLFVTKLGTLAQLKQRGEAFYKPRRQ